MKFLKFADIARSTVLGITTDIPRPKLTAVPISKTDVIGQVKIKIDRTKLLETTELELWRLRNKKLLQKFITVEFDNEIGED